MCPLARQSDFYVPELKEANKTKNEEEADDSCTDVAGKLQTINVFLNIIVCGCSVGKVTSHASIVMLNHQQQVDGNR